MIQHKNIHDIDKKTLLDKVQEGQMSEDLLEMKETERDEVPGGGASLAARNLFPKRTKNKKTLKKLKTEEVNKSLQIEKEALLLNYIHQINTNTFENIVRGLRGNKLKDYLSSMTKLTSLQKEVLVGIMLGDGNIQSNGGKNFFFKFDQKAINHDYVSLVYLIFQQFVGTHPKLRLVNGIAHSWWFRTYRLSCFKFFHDQFYGLDAHGQSVRRVPKLLHRWITPISLAFWFMDDGAMQPYGYALHTECFQLHQVKDLQKLLGNKFGLETSIQSDTKKSTRKTYYFLYISSRSIQRFNSLVRPFILPCMLYKLHPDKETSSSEPQSNGT